MKKAGVGTGKRVMNKETVYYKSRDAFGALEVTSGHFSAAFFKTRNYKFNNVASVEAAVRPALLSEKLTPLIAGVLLLIAAVVIAIININGFLCWVIIGLMGIVFFVLSLSVKEMFDISITFLDGSTKNEVLPANYQGREFVEAIQIALSEKSSH